MFKALKKHWTCFPAAVSPDVPYWEFTWLGVAIPSRTISLSFEKSARGKVGPSLVDPLSQIEEAMQRSQTPSAKPAYFMMIGHSFGAVVLETAVTAMMAKRLAAPGPRDVQPPANLIAYINSANAAAASRQLVNLFAERGLTYKAGNKDMPLIVSATSIADKATGLIYASAHFFEKTDRTARGALPADIPNDNYSSRTLLCGQPGQESAPKDLSDKKLWMHTAPYTPLLVSHEVQVYRNQAPDICPVVPKEVSKGFTRRTAFVTS